VSTLTATPVRRAILPLPRIDRSPAIARHHVLSVARSWQVAIDLDALALVVSEYVTNAVRHAKPPAHGPDAIRVTFEAGVRHAVLTVHDMDATSVCSCNPFDGWDLPESGYGLVLVRELTARSGIRCTRIGGHGQPGKDAWAAWDVNTHLYSGSVS
jgi:anti-sigma regulatory factor (Ser/Thr protein kinase)